jgi:histone deacetylase complex regulatory component SIN3
MALVYTSLEEAHGSPFKVVSSPMATPAAPPGNSKKGVQTLVENMESSLPLDKDPSTKTFTPPPQPDAVAVQSSMANQPDKISRILSLVEQNKTGYETSSSKDMFLYVLTGVMFLFTFDTFVTLGRGMRG